MNLHCDFSCMKMVTFFRSPWTNSYDPPLEDGAMPSERLRKLEVEANAAFDQVRTNLITNFSNDELVLQYLECVYYDMNSSNFFASTENCILKEECHQYIYGILMLDSQVSFLSKKLATDPRK